MYFSKASTVIKTWINEKQKNIQVLANNQLYAGSVINN